MTERKQKQRQGRRSSALPSSTAPLLLVVVGALLVLGSVGWYAFQAFGGGAPDADVEAAAEASTTDVARVSLENARAAHELGSAVFLDVRTQDEYAEGHIPGALLIPLNELPDRIGELNPNDWIITY